MAIQNQTNKISTIEKKLADLKGEYEQFKRDNPMPE
jgi:hypothetical protein